MLLLILTLLFLMYKKNDFTLLEIVVNDLSFILNKTINIIFKEMSLGDFLVFMHTEHFIMFTLMWIITMVMTIKYFKNSVIMSAEQYDDPQYRTLTFLKMISWSSLMFVMTVLMSF